MKFPLRFLFVSAFIFISLYSIAQQSSAQTGYATYYADAFQGRFTSCGEKYDNKLYTAAHATLPFQTLVKVTNLKNNLSVIVKINDRCPKYYNRIIDLSKVAAKKIDILTSGIANCKLEVISLSNLNVILQAPDSLFTGNASFEGSLKSMIRRMNHHYTGDDIARFRNFIYSKLLSNNYTETRFWRNFLIRKYYSLAIQLMQKPNPEFYS